MAVPTKTVHAATRSVIGASGWLMPITAGRLLGMDVSEDASAALFLRLGGSRDFALAAGPLVTAGPSRSRMLKIAAACDLGDLVAVAIALRFHAGQDEIEGAREMGAGLLGAFAGMIEDSGASWGAVYMDSMFEVSPFLVGMAFVALQ